MTGRNGRLRLPSASAVRLLPRDELIKTNDLDQADWNYRPVLGWVSQLRWRAVVALLEDRRRGGRLLEVGYGSGVFLPELDRHADETHAVDIHRAASDVRSTLIRHGVDARLAVGSAMALPYRDAAFDTVVAVSTLEFVPDVEQSVAELVRVTKPDGTTVIVTPGRSWLLDTGLRLLTGHRGEDTFEGRRGTIVPALEATCSVVAHPVPRVLRRAAPLYTVVAATPLRTRGVRSARGAAAPRGHRRTGDS